MAKTYYGIKYEIHRSTWAVEADSPEEALELLQEGDGEEVYTPDYVCSLADGEGSGLEDRVLKPEEHSQFSVPEVKENEDE